MRTLAIVVAAIVVLLIGAVVALPYLVDVNDYKSEITLRVAEATGRQLEVGGDIRFKLLPTPRLAVAELAIANPPGSAVPDLARVKSLDVEVALWPLLTGEILVRRIVLIEPVVELIRAADGTVNWRDQRDDGGEAAAGPPAGGLDTVRLDQMMIEDATIIYRDHLAGIAERLDGLDAELSAASLDGPYRVVAFADWRELPLALSAELGDFGGGRAAPARLAVETRDGDARLELIGVLSAAEPARRLTGRAKLEGNRFAALAAALARAYGASWTIQGAEGTGFEATAELAASAGALTLDKLALRVGETALGGDLQLAFGPRPNLNIRLSASRLDLAPWLADGTDGAAAATSPVERGGGGFVLPAGLTGAIELEAAAVTWPGGVARRARVAAQMADGAVVVSRATALLAGGSTVALSGRLVTPGGRPRFEGRLEAGSNNMRAMLDRLGVDTKAVSVDRLRKFHLVAGFRVTDEVVQVHEVDLRLDTSRITGAAAYALRRRPSFSIDLAVDRANLDAYIAKPPAEAAALDDRPLLVRLGEFDSNAKLRVGRLVYQGQTAEDVEFDLALFDGTLTIRRARLGRVAGAAATLTGSVADLRGTPRFDLAARLAAADFTGLLRRFDVVLPPTAAGLAGDVKLDITGLAADATVALAADLGDAALDVRGRVRDALDVPRVDLEISGRHQSLAVLAGRLDLPVAPLDGADGPLRVEAKLNGTAEALKFAIRLGMAGAAVVVDGSGGLAAEELAYRLDLLVKHDNAVALARGLGIDFQPAADPVGDFLLTAGVEGRALAAEIPEVELRVGPAAIRGGFDVDFAGPRPMLTARLTANEIAADLFLPAATAGLAAPDAPDRPRWSEAPFALDYLQAVDADVELNATAFTMRGYRLAEPRMTFTLEDGRLTLEQLAGRLFGGDVALTGTVDTAPVPTLEIRAGLTEADWRAALTAVAGIDRLSGRFDLGGNFTAQGHNQREMVESLNGEARVAVREGAIAGIDLPGLNAGLGGAGDAAELIAATLSGGQTALHAASGTWPIRSGVVTVADSVARLDGGAATLSGRIELPAWRMNLSAALQPTEPPGVPAFGIDFAGPIDDPARRLRTRELEAFITRRAEARQAEQRRAAEAEAKIEPPAVAEDMLKDLDQDAAEGLLDALSRRRN